MSLLHKDAHQQGIRRRWMVNSIGTVSFVLLVALIAFSLFVGGYYYNSIRSALQTQATAVGDFFSSYATSERTYLEMANAYINDFDERESLELQFISTSGKIVLSSYGLTSGGRPGTSDINDAVTSKSVANWSGRDPTTGERIMAVSAPVLYGSEVKGVIRLVSSLSIVDRQFILMVVLALGVCVAAIAMVYVTNQYFIRSIVEPMTSITETAKRIAAGSYGIQIERRFDDEIGDLATTINNMSRQIGQNEKTQREFISSVSHELRTPLTAINGWSETLLSGELHDPDSIHMGLSIIASEGRRLSSMVEELLEFSRIEDGRFTLNVEPVDISAEFEDAVYTYRQLYRKKNIRMKYTPCEEDLPLIPGDPERLRQVFSNLLDNAAKHGGGDQDIEASVDQDGDTVVIRIRDHGPGVAEKDLPHLKEKFYKGSSKARGSGIGLAVCDEIVGRLGGSLTLENAEGGGCLVTIRLPMSNPTVNEGGSGMQAKKENAN